MPRKNGQGPRGNGSQSGRGLGLCKKVNSEVNEISESQNCLNGKGMMGKNRRSSRRGSCL